MDLAINGKKVSSPRLTVLEGEKGTITQEDKNGKTMIEVIAKENIAPNGKKGIFMNFTVSQIAQDGTAKIISQPQIIAFPKQKAEITVGDSSSKQELNLSVVANVAKILK